MQSKDEIEEWYSKEDPWEYQTNPDDIYRKKCILSLLSDEYDRVLDIGMGEGFITKDLPGKEIFGIELSDLAKERVPKNINIIDEPEGNYDLIVCTGVLYEQYDHWKIANWIKTHASKHVLIGGIKDWLKSYPFGEFRRSKGFPYRDMYQILNLYEV